jgi:hypothetical protein
MGYERGRREARECQIDSGDPRNLRFLPDGLLSTTEVALEDEGREAHAAGSTLASRET